MGGPTVGTLGHDAGKRTRREGGSTLTALGPRHQGCKDLHSPNFVALAVSLSLTAGKGTRGTLGPHS